MNMGILDIIISYGIYIVFYVVGGRKGVGRRSQGGCKEGAGIFAGPYFVRVGG